MIRRREFIAALGGATCSQNNCKGVDSVPIDKKYSYNKQLMQMQVRELRILKITCYCQGSIVRFGNWRRQIFLDSGILFRFKDS